MKDETIGLISIGAFIAIVECVALAKGIDGQLFLTAIGALTSIFGYYIGKLRGKKEGGK